MNTILPEEPDSTSDQVSTKAGEVQDYLGDLRPPVRARDQAAAARRELTPPSAICSEPMTSGSQRQASGKHFLQTSTTSDAIRIEHPLSTSRLTRCDEP